MQKLAPPLLRFLRFIRLLSHVVLGLLQSIFYPHVSLHTQRHMMQNWAIGLLTILNIKLHCHGKLPGIEIPRALLAANHVSWLDVCVLMATCPTRFVAKTEISRWPVLGLLCRNVGTLFIERSKRSDTMRINQQISDVLEVSERVAVFPEGTTTNGKQLNHFHASLLQSAITAGALLYPVAICYRTAAGSICEEAAYVDSSLIVSLQAILRQTSITADVTFIEPIQCGMKNRRELARLAEKEIANTLSLPISHKQTGKPFDLPIV
ncbi:MAG: 1-acyl-sn-glycerol-3-phosphate acyltransferase [Nitrosomonas sp. PRO4]|nr:1-acyl-sn-glycerol-3-phosphate acyltransferase [Nitrosomonas sp. PRO4]